MTRRRPSNGEPFKAAYRIARALVWCGVLLTLAPPARSQAVDQARLRNMRREIERLRGELESLAERERSLLGEVERLGVELRLREAEFEEVSLRMEGIQEAIRARGERLEALEEVQAERSRYLAFRLREIYKEGPRQALRTLVGGGSEGPWSGLRYASLLSERDGKMLSAFREDTRALEEERSELEATRRTLGRTREELSRTRSRLESSRRNRTRMLESIRSDKDKRQTAIAELEQASSALSTLIRSLEPAEERTALDMRKFKGLLDWPAGGRVSARYGTVIHPRFKTRVPHPGLDIEGRLGDGIRSIFDGRVVFASWMRGYGLTVIVDHGQGLLSVYAHASVLLAEKGQRVLRGETLGYIGDTGSLRGPFLYFELRIDGRTVDPAGWLRPR